MAQLPPAELQYMLDHIGDDKRPEVIVPLIVGGIAAYTAVALRLYARRKGAVHLGLDDLFVCIALLTYTAYIIALGLTAKYGMGRHIILVTDPRGFASAAVAAQAVYEASILSIKFSILFLYLRIFPNSWFRKVVTVLIVFIACNNTAQFFVNIFQCVPFSKNYDPTTPGFCVDQGRHILVEGVINIITDWVMLALPVPLVWRLNTSTRKKWQICGMFLSGGIVCVVSIVRLFYVLDVGSFDASWDDVNGAMISGIEQSLGIIVACIPTFRLLASSRLGSQYQGRTGYYSNDRTDNSQQQSFKTPRAVGATPTSDSGWQSLGDEAYVHNNETIALNRVPMKS